MEPTSSRRRTRSLSQRILPLLIRMLRKKLMRCLYSFQLSKRSTTRPKSLSQRNKTSTTVSGKRSTDSTSRRLKSKVLSLTTRKDSPSCLRVFKKLTTRLPRKIWRVALTHTCSSEWREISLLTGLSLTTSRPPSKTSHKSLMARRVTRVRPRRLSSSQRTSSIAWWRILRRNSVIDKSVFLSFSVASPIKRNQ